MKIVLWSTSEIFLINSIFSFIFKFHFLPQWTINYICVWIILKNLRNCILHKISYNSKLSLMPKLTVSLLEACKFCNIWPILQFHHTNSNQYITATCKTCNPHSFFFSPNWFRSINEKKRERKRERYKKHQKDTTNHKFAIKPFQKARDPFDRNKIFLEDLQRTNFSRTSETSLQ